MDNCEDYRMTENNDTDRLKAFLQSLGIHESCYHHATIETLMCMGKAMRKSKEINVARGNFVLRNKIEGFRLDEDILYMDGEFDWSGYGSEKQKECWDRIKDYLTRDPDVLKHDFTIGLSKLLAEAENRIETDAKLIEILSSAKGIEISDIARLITPAKLDESVSCFSADIDDESYRLGWNSCVEDILANHSES